MDFEFNNTTPIYIQLVEQIKLQIISGKLSPLERLPSVRELGAIAKVNPNTVQKALTELEDTGLIFTERTNGKFVTDNAPLIEKFRKEYARNLSREFLNNMKKAGYTEKESLQYIKELGGK